MQVGIVEAFCSESKWEYVPAKRLFRNLKRVNSGMVEANRLALTMKGVINRALDDSRGLQSSDYSAYQIFEKNDLVFKLIDLENIKTSRVGIVHERGIMSPAYIRLSGSIEEIYSKFYYWYFFALYLNNIFNKLGGGIRQNLTPKELLEVPVPKIDRESQIGIAAFIDRETTRIDKLIEEKQTFINLLKEKRQALISHVVTKGLDPDVKMKESGIEWIGEVPNSWTVKSYRYACKIYRGKFGHRPRNDPALYDGDYPFIQTGDIARAKKTIENYKQTLNEQGVKVSQKFPAGTLVMAIAANIGVTAILGFEAYAPDSVVGFNPKSDIDLDFLRFSFIAALPALEKTSTQSTQANLNIDRIAALKAVFPPIDEQRQIVKILDYESIRIEKLIGEVESSIELLQEHRTALISAAVTGKIDVRSDKEVAA